MQAAQPGSAAAGQPGAAAAALAPAVLAGLEEGCDDDLFMQLAAAAEEEDDAGDRGGSGGGSGTASQPSKTSSAGGPRLSWAAKAASAGIAGAVPPGHQPRQAVVLAPGSIPRVAPPPPSALLPPSSQAAPSSRGVATFGAPAPSKAAAGGAAAKGGFADIGQGTLVERYAGLKVRQYLGAWEPAIALMLMTLHTMGSSAWRPAGNVHLCFVAACTHVFVIANRHASA